MSADLAAIVARDALFDVINDAMGADIAQRDRRALLVLLKETRDAGQEVIAADGAIARQEMGADRRWDVALAALDALLDRLSALPSPADKTGDVA